jgi:hypothetical protein
MGSGDASGRGRCVLKRVRRRSGGLIGFGSGPEEVAVVALDGIADGPAPVVGVEGVDVFVPGKMDSLDEGLGDGDDGAGGARLDVTACYADDEAAECGDEIASGEVFAGEEIREIAGEFIGGAGRGVFAGAVGAEVGMASERGMRHSWPSAKVKRHKDLRSFALREDIKVSLE